MSDIVSVAFIEKIATLGAQKFTERDAKMRTEGDMVLIERTGKDTVLEVPRRLCVIERRKAVAGAKK